MSPIPSAVTLVVAAEVSALWSVVAVSMPAGRRIRCEDG
jgi:hypothetical protein